MGRRVLLNLLTVGVSTAARLLGTLALFALMARAVSVEQFGVFSYWYTFSVIAGTFTDYGFAQQILKEALSEDSAKVAMRIRLLWRAKLIIALVCALVSIVCIFSTSRSSPEVMSAMLIVAAGLLGSYFEFYAMVLRGRQLYRDESRMSLANALGGSLLVGCVAFLTKNVVMASIVLFIVRTVSVYAAHQRVAVRALPEMQSRQPLSESVFSTLRKGIPYAFDNVATQLFANVDAISAKHFLDTAATGVYLAGTRLVQAALAGLPVLASVFLPTLASPSARQPNKLKAFKLGMYCLALLVGLSAAAVFGYLAREIPLVLFGANFLKLEELMPWFGGFVCFRYLAAAPGIQLTAHGAQSSRAVITAASLVVTLASVAYLYRDNGQLLSIHLCKSMAIGAFFQFLMYSTALVLVNRKTL